MKKKIYMAVTPDEYELPLFVTDDLDEMAARFGKSKACILSSISHKRVGHRKGVTFVRIIEEDEQKND